uniref:DUF4939 domain-containing protein n=1 Tax=Maylandia zebra TaxID=106582 RepID=A0A3P9DLE5_9CICH
MPHVDPAEFERLKAEVLYLRGVVDRMSTKMESLTETVLQLSSSVTSLQRQPAPVSAEPRIGLPDKWNGVDGRPDGLLATLDMMFECQPTKYATARAKVAMLTSLLSGQAQEWAAPIQMRVDPPHPPPHAHTLPADDREEVSPVHPPAMD